VSCASGDDAARYEGEGRCRAAGEVLNARGAYIIQSRALAKFANVQYPLKSHGMTALGFQMENCM